MKRSATRKREEIFKCSPALHESPNLREQSRFKRSGQIAARINRRLSSISRWANEPDAEILNTHQMVNIALRFSIDEALTAWKTRIHDDGRHGGTLYVVWRNERSIFAKIDLHLRFEHVFDIMPLCHAHTCLKNRTFDSLIDDWARTRAQFSSHVAKGLLACVALRSVATAKGQGNRHRMFNNLNKII